MSKLMELVDKYGGACIAYGRNGGPDTHDEMAERQSELRTRLEALERDAARFQHLQNIGKKEAQAFFWVWKSRKQRAKAIDAAMEADK